MLHINRFYLFIFFLNFTNQFKTLKVVGDAKVVTSDRVHIQSLSILSTLC